MAEFPLVPGSTIGILGGGQLGRMLAQAAAHGMGVALIPPFLIQRELAVLPKKALELGLKLD